MESLQYSLGEISIRNTTEEDLEFVLQAENMPENAPYVAQWSRMQHIQAFDDSDVLHVIIESENNRVGYAIVAGLQNSHKAIELKRIVVVEKGRGLGRKALELFKHLAFHELKAHRLWLDVREYNERAIHLYKSLGFQLEGLIRECLLIDGEYASHYIMSILEQEYKSYME